MGKPNPWFDQCNVFYIYSDCLFYLLFLMLVIFVFNNNNKLCLCKNNDASLYMLVYIFKLHSYCCLIIGKEAVNAEILHKTMLTTFWVFTNLLFGKNWQINVAFKLVLWNNETRYGRCISLHWRTIYCQARTVSVSKSKRQWFPESLCLTRSLP